MNVTAKDIVNALTMFGLSAEVTDFSFFQNDFDEEESEGKFILRADVSNGKTYVVRFIRQEDYPRVKTEEQSIFAEYLREHGVATAKKYKSGDAYCTAYRLASLDFDLTVEDYIGKAGNFRIDANAIHKIGRLTGQMHRISAQNSLHLSADTLYNLIGHNEFSGYRAFQWFGNEGFINKEMFDRICAAYEAKMERIRAVWESLPCYALQGDTCVYNLTYNDGELGVFDYNNAGNGVLVYDMMVHGFYTAYHSRKNYTAETVTERDKRSLFDAYCDGYASERPLTASEKAVFDDIFALTKGMHHLRINFVEGSLGKLIESKEHGKIDALLREIYHDISGDSRSC